MIAALLPAFGPSDDIAGILQAAAVGGLIGVVVTARIRARNPDADTWIFTARWTLLWAAGAVLVALADWLGWPW